VERSPRSAPVQQHPQQHSFPSEQSFSINAAYHAILQEDGGQRLFTSFGLEVGKRYVSPFRADATKKNFSISQNKHGTVLFKDFASGDAGSFTALLQGFGYHSFEAQIRYAAGLYGFALHDAHSVSAPLPVRPQQPRSYAVPPTQKAARTAYYRVPKLHTDHFTSDELQTLQRLSGGMITREVLELFNIRALRSYTDEGRNDKGKHYGGTREAAFTLTAPSSDGNSYAYCYYKSDTYSPFFNRAKNFHLKRNEYVSDVKFALGLNELRPNEPAYLVEGIKDCLILLAQGYNAFTLGGVQSRLQPSVMERLQANRNTLAICFDTDFAGINAAQKLASALSTQHSALNTFCCTLPRLERQETKDAPKPSENDLADYIVRYGFDDELRAALSEALNIPLTLQRRMLMRGGISIPVQELRITKHCSESHATIATIENAIASTPRLFLSAPTGSGKTFCMLNHLAMRHHARTGGRTVLVVPTIALAEQIEQEYRHLPLISITGNDNELSLLEARTSSKIIVCTANSVHKILYRQQNASQQNNSQQTPCLLDEENILFIVDEGHKLFSDYHYRDAAMRSVMTAIERVGKAHPSNRVVCISATPSLMLHHAPEQVRFEYLHLTTTHQQARSLAFCPYFCREQEAVNTILREYQHGAVVVRINSEAALKTIQTLLMQQGVNANDIDIITSRRRTTSPEYKSITKESKITRRVILTTSLLDCGVNITTPTIRAVLVFDEKNPATIVQFISRFRCVDHVRVMLFYKQSTTTEQYRLLPCSSVQIFQSNCFQAEMRAVEYNAKPNRKGKNLHQAVGKKSAFKMFDHSMMFDSDHNVWTPDVAGLIAHVESLRNKTLSRDELRAELEAYSVSIVEREELFVGQETSSTAAPMVSAEAVQTLTTEAKEHTKTEERLIITMLAEAPELLLEAVYHTTESKTTRTEITTLYPAIAGKPHTRRKSEDCTLLLTTRADLFSTTASETIATRYMELRTRLFTHEEAVQCVEHFHDARVWARFSEHFAMHQRLELKHLNLHTTILTPHDQKKLQREVEVRALIVNAATVGIVFEGTSKKQATRKQGKKKATAKKKTTAKKTTTTHIPFALHRADDIAQRVNAFTEDTFRLTKQRAGQLVNALFTVHYERKRVPKNNQSDSESTEQHFSGYYTFAHNSQGIICKTLADFLTEAGVDGAAYTERFQQAMMRVVEEKAVYYTEKSVR
jgi:Type III restriction enzyme, res subunit/Toprim-like